MGPELGANSIEDLREAVCAGALEFQPDRSFAVGRIFMEGDGDDCNWSKGRWHFCLQECCPDELEISDDNRDPANSARFASELAS